MKLQPASLLALLFALSLWACKPTQVATTNTNNTPDTPTDTTQAVTQTTPQEPQESPFVNYRATNTRYFDLLHTKLEVSFNFEKQYLNGKATLQLKPYFYPQKQLVLDAKGFIINKVQLIEQQQYTNLKYQYNDFKLTINLPRTYNNTETLNIYIDYVARPNELPEGGSDAITSDKGLYFINPMGTEDKPTQIWTQGETEASSCWFPTIDSPNERTTQEMYITVPQRFKTLSNGRLVSSKQDPQTGTRTDYWNMDQPHAPYLFMMAIGEYAVVKDTWNGMEVSYWVEPEFEKYARNIFGNTPEMLTFFSEKLGVKYPWQKYAQVVVRDFVSGAMENTTASIFMEDLQVDSRELLDSHWDNIIAHELFHHWFGDLVTCESWSNLPLNESFANYSEYLWNEYKYGTDEAEYHAFEERQGYFNEAEEEEKNLIRYYYESREDMFDAHSYNKGGRILHMLRYYVGDDAFFQSLKLYLEQHQYAAAEVHDLRHAFEQVTGQDLNWFFSQWFLASGHPSLSVKHTYDQQAKAVVLEVQQTQNLETTPLYKLPLEVEIWANNQDTTQRIEVLKSKQTFVLPFDQEPQAVVFDAQHQLLATVQHEQTPQELLFQFNNHPRFIKRYSALVQFYQSANDRQQLLTTLLTGLDDPFWVIRDISASAFEGFVGPEAVLLKEKLKGLLIDPKADVRATAMTVLSSIDSTGITPQIRKALQDSSYSVVGAALGALLKSQDPNAPSILAQYRNTKKINIILPLTEYYTNLEGLENKEWLFNNTQELKGADLYFYLQYFGPWLLKTPYSTQVQGAEVLEKLANPSQNRFIIQTAYDMLGLLPLEDIEERKKRVRDAQTSPAVLESLQD